MANVDVTINKDADGNLSFEHPDGKEAIELGKAATISCKLGSGFSGTPSFDWLEVKFGDTTKRLDLSTDDSTSADFENGPSLSLYSNVRRNVYIADESDAPATGEWDVEFSVGITDGDGQKTLDPEIKLKSGVAPGTAQWTEHTPG